MLETRLLRYFVAVAEAEHIGKAATLLHVSQSPLSRQIRQLEESLGLPLFEREHRRLRLSSAGKWFLGRVRPLLGQLEALQTDAERLSRGEAGTLRIGFVKSALWTSLLPRALQRLRASRGEVAIELRSAASSVQLAAVRRGELDVGLVHEATADAELSSLVLREEALWLALPEAHPLATRRRIAPADLDGVDWVALRSGTRAHATGEAFLAACRRYGFLPTVRLTASDQETVLGLVAAGMGLALLPRSAASARRVGVVLRHLAWLKLKRGLHAVSRSSNASPLAREFLDCLAAVRDAG